MTAKQTKSSNSKPPEPLTLLEQTFSEQSAILNASGLTVTEREQPTDTTQLTATFVPRRGAMPIMQQVSEKICEACGTPLDAKGRYIPECC
jgi:hypothetical protein